MKSIEWLSPSPGRPLSVAEARKVRPLSALSRLLVPPMRADVGLAAAGRVGARGGRLPGAVLGLAQREVGGVGDERDARAQPVDDDLGDRAVGLASLAVDRHALQRAGADVVEERVGLAVGVAGGRGSRRPRRRRRSAAWRGRCRRATAWTTARWRAGRRARARRGRSRQRATACRCRRSGRRGGRRRRWSCRRCRPRTPRGARSACPARSPGCATAGRRAAGGRCPGRRQRPCPASAPPRGEQVRRRPASPGGG